MVQYLVTYSVETGKEGQHGDWLHRIGQPFWQKQAGFRGFRAFSTLVGSGPDWVQEVDFDSADNLVLALDSDEAKRLLEEFEHLVTDLSTKILIAAQVPAGVA